MQIAFIVLSCVFFVLLLSSLVLTVLNFKQTKANQEHDGDSSESACKDLLVSVLQNFSHKGVDVEVNDANGLNCLRHCKIESHYPFTDLSRRERRH